MKKNSVWVFKQSLLAAFVKQICVLLLLCFLVGTAHATKTQDERFEEYLRGTCFSTSFTEPVDTTAFTPEQANHWGIVCSAISSPGDAGVVSLSVNLSGTSVTGKSLINKIDKTEDLDKQGNGGSFDVGGFGFMYSQQSGDTTRQQTELQTGSQTDIDGESWGVDYTFLDRVTVGMVQSEVDDDGFYIDGSGTTRVESDAEIYYVAVQIVDGLSFDYYTGSSDNRHFYTRDAGVGVISGVISGEYDGEQDLDGYSISYNYPIENFSFGIYYAADEVDTDLDPYTETGVSDDPISTGARTLLELNFPQQQIKSDTKTVGYRLDYAFNFGWGTLIPAYELAKVDEDKNDKRFIPTTLSFTPDYFFEIETDAPDRKYKYETLSLMLALNNGIQIYYINEERKGHSFLKDDATTIGALFAF